MSRLDEIRDRLEVAQQQQTDDATLLDDIEYLLNYIDMLEDCVIVYTPADSVVIYDKSGEEVKGTSRHDWFGEGDA